MFGLLPTLALRLNGARAAKTFDLGLRLVIRDLQLSVYGVENVSGRNTLCKRKKKKRLDYKRA
jgi:hypothetical protein